MKNRIAKNFHMPLNSPSGAKTAKSSPPRCHMGGADWGTCSWDAGPRHGLGGPYTRKKFFKTHVELHTQRPQYAKKF